jgi:hypothetical protein
MVKTPTRVAIVVERDFSDKLLELSRSHHVWIAETDRNREAAERVWELAASSKNEGVTTFTVDDTGSSESWILAVLDAVDEHHGLRSAQISRLTGRSSRRAARPLTH